MADMMLISANKLPTSSGETQREIKVLVQGVPTGVNKAKTKPKMNHNWPGMKAGRDHPIRKNQLLIKNLKLPIECATVFLR